MKNKLKLFYEAHETEVIVAATIGAGLLIRAISIKSIDSMNKRRYPFSYGGDIDVFQHSAYS